MTLSVFDLFTVGIGPSSSHTVGPMRAARMFVENLAANGQLTRTRSVRAELFGSLGATGHGHGSEQAVVLGLEGADPATVDVREASQRMAMIRSTQSLRLAGQQAIAFDVAEHLVLHRRKSLPGHPNGMLFTARDGVGAVLASATYYSVGGGFVLESAPSGEPRAVPDTTTVRFPFANAAELLETCDRERLRISDVMLANELAWRPEGEVRRALLRIWSVMTECIDAGLRTGGVLPGGLRVPRRASSLHRRLQSRTTAEDPLAAMDWVNTWAMAVNEENAAGGRVVTAPTNGAAGVLPAVLRYYSTFVPGADDDGVVRFLLTAAAIGVIVKLNASISGAEVGCQGEVGSACAMAAAGLCEVLGGDPGQVENAAEVGIEHNLGLTCDPVGGLVQIPCIERNAIAAMKAINAARLALHGDGSHKVSLDRAVKTMRDTGRDMHVKYKETSRGGLAVNVVEC